jgi:hypothetical protein
MDSRIAGADAYHRQHRWLERCIDDLTMQSRYALEQERRLRDEVRREAEARQLQADADAELVAHRRRAKPRRSGMAA